MVVHALRHARGRGASATPHRRSSRSCGRRRRGPGCCGRCAGLRAPWRGMGQTPALAAAGAPAVRGATPPSTFDSCVGRTRSNTHVSAATLVVRLSCGCGRGYLEQEASSLEDVTRPTRPRYLFFAPEGLRITTVLSAVLMIHGRATFGRTACFECSHTKAASFARVSLPQADGHVASSKDAAPCLACSCAVLQLLVSCTSRGQPRGRAAALPPRPAARPLSPLPSPPALLPPPATASPPSPPPPPGASVIPASRAALTTRVARSSAARRRPRRQYRQPRQAPMPRTSTWKGG